MFSYQSRNITIDYTVEVRPNITEITVCASTNNGVKLVVPTSFNESNRQFVLAKKAAWILEQLAETKMETKTEQAPVQQQQETVEETAAAFVPAFEDGDKIPYLGRQYRLNIIKEDRTDAALTFRAKFITALPESWNEQQTNEGVQALLKDWYIARAGDKFQECLKTLGKQLNNVPSSIECEDLQNETSRVKADGTIVLNWRLLTAPMATIEFVLASSIAEQTNMSAEDLFDNAAQRAQWLEENELIVF